MKKIFKILLKIFIVIIIIIVLLGIIFPGLIWPQSLGVKYTKADYDSIMSKLNFVKDEVKSGSREDYKYVYGEVKDVSTEFTSSELTAFFNYNRPDYYALKNVQVRVNADGTVEAIATADVNYFLNDVLGGKYSKEEIKKNLPILGMLPKNVNLYLKMSGSVTNNTANITVTSAKVQGISIPSNYIKSDEAFRVVNEGANNVMKKSYDNSKSVISKLKVEDSVLKFSGSIPSSLERVLKND